MFVRYVANRAKGKTYRYPQLVESYRKPDGTPAHRVLCTLTQLSETSLANLRKALEAGRKGESVVIAPDAAEVFQSVGVMANLRYLDLAVSYEMWHQLQLNALLDDILPKSQSSVSAQDIVCALALHRCTDPGSKLAAARWYSKTALPLLQDIPPARFNNTRVHRTLEDLEQVESELQARLAQHLGTSQGAFTALFLDMTDTWFVGRGPQMAYKARTKEGMLRHKVGLALLCDRRGYPVRWQTLPGNYYEADVMGSLVQQISTLEWVHQVPLVLDRMMGKAGVLAQLSQSGVRFVTALPANEFESWTTDVPWQPLADVAVAGTRSSVKDDLARVHAALKRTKMVMCADRWVLDLGVVTRTGLSTEAGDGPVAKALRLAVSMQADIDAKVVHNQAELARRMEVSPKCVGIYLKLTKLTPELQRRVLAGEAEALSMPQLRSIASKQAKQQQASFDALRKKPRQKRNKGCPPQLAKSACEAGPGISIRLVAGFKPEAFVADRRKALDTRREVDAFVEDLNRRLRSKHSRRTEASIQAEVDRFLRSKKWVGLFTVTMKGQATGDFQVELKLNQEAWAKRRRYDGFNLFVAHPDIPISAPDLIALYYAKDAVEKDFQTIKSELEIRPVRHRTNPKVKAHVTICMLALLIERHLEQRLRDAGLPMTASALFEVLSAVHLNALKIGSGTTHTVTRCDEDVASIITALNMQHLVDDSLVLERLHLLADSTS